MSTLVRFSYLGCAVIVAATIAPSFAAGTSEPAPYIDLLGVIRDFPPQSEHPDFLINPSVTPGSRSANNISLLLDSEEKPVYVGGGKRVTQDYRDAAGNKIAWCVPLAAGDLAGTLSGSDTGGIASASTFSQWFRDVPGMNMSRSWTIRLEREDSGAYVFDVSDFHPIDSQLLGNGPDEHNFYFTYEIDCSFTAAPGQYLTFTGDDDCWIYVNNSLVIDHGGIAANRRQHLTLDRLGLTAGQSYGVRFFFAERYQPQSQFRLETNIESLSTATSVTVMDACD